MIARQRGTEGLRPVHRLADGRGLAALALYAMIGAVPICHALAQDIGSGRSSAHSAVPIPSPPPRLEVPSMVIGAPASETTLGIALGRGAAVPANSYVRIRGLSPRMALTEGHVIAPGAWAVPIAALPDLRVVVPAGASGRVDVSIALVTIDGGVVAEAKTTLVVAPASLSAAAPARPDDAKPVTRGAQSDAPGAAPDAPKAPGPIAAVPPVKQPETAPALTAPRRDVPLPTPLTPAARERTEGFLARGRKLLDEGNISSARLFFRRAADEGLAEGALALGATFDPAELDRLRAVGTRPDPAEARRWYEKARELGAGPAADRRLERLGSR
jgi:hypothetical protein